jgi:hypothetical protein
MNQSLETHSSPASCECGQHIRLEHGLHDTVALLDDEPQKSFPLHAHTAALDASFVHLPSSILRDVACCPASSEPGGREFRDTLHDICLLEQALHDSDNPPHLCLECIQRVEQALLADTERLKYETKRYDEAVRDERDRQRSLHQALNAVSFAGLGDNFQPEFMSQSADADSSSPLLQRAEEAFRNEIEALQQCCDQQEDEIGHLRSLVKEQELIKQELQATELLVAAERNSLEVEARAFDNDHEQLCDHLLSIQKEVETLSSSQIRWPAFFLDVRIDTRGLRYPLINDLRLAYRAKGDLSWNEIQTAWSLAAQLLLIVGTIFEFASQEWKIVPLSHCAKLIQYPGGKKQPPTVYNIGCSGKQAILALLAWNALLHEIIKDTSEKLNQAHKDGLLDLSVLPPLPFAMAKTTIGDLNLLRLSPEDDVRWSQAIQYTATNLQWLSVCTSAHTMQKVCSANFLE